MPVTATESTNSVIGSIPNSGIVTGPVASKPGPTHPTTALGGRARFDNKPRVGGLRLLDLGLTVYLLL